MPAHQALLGPGEQHDHDHRYTQPAGLCDDRLRQFPLAAGEIQIRAASGLAAHVVAFTDAEDDGTRRLQEWAAVVHDHGAEAPDLRSTRHGFEHAKVRAAGTSGPAGMSRYPARYRASRKVITASTRR